MKYGKS